MLDTVLGRMAYFNIRLKPSKCSFGMTSVEFLGHIFDQNCVYLSDKRVRGIQDIPIPTSVSSIRSFVGMVNYFHDFIPSLSSYLRPLTDLAKKKRNFGEYGLEMTEKEISAFQIVKDQEAHHTSRVIMNAHDLLILYKDASTKAIGGVLMQIHVFVRTDHKNLVYLADSTGR